MWPVLQRELRAEARNPIFRRLRLVTVLAIIAVIVVYVAQVSGLAAQSGSQLFFAVHVTVGLILLMICPLLTADCLSRERREGTLGLLFLTPLRPGEIVMGKAAIHFLRAFSLWLAALPVMTLPFLFGGVTTTSLVIVFVAEFSVCAIALSSGVFASVLTKRGELAALFAYLLTAGWLGVTWLIAGGVLALTSFFQLGAGQVLALIVYSLLAIGVTLIQIWVTALRLPFAWQTDTQPAQRQPPSALMSPPRSLDGWVRRRRLRLLGRNPLVWLQTRHLPSALGRWGWVWLVSSSWIFQLSEPSGINRFDGVRLVEVVEFVMLFGMVAVSARALHAERQAGTLELLLVSPIRIGQLRLSVGRSVWHQFGPAIVLDLAIWAYLRHSFQDDELRFGPEALVVSSLVVLPFIGARCAARQTHFLGAMIATGLVGVALPAALPTLFAWAFRICEWGWQGWMASGSGKSGFEYSGASRGWSVFVQLLLGAAAIHWLNREFRERRLIVRSVAA